MILSHLKKETAKIRPGGQKKGTAKKDVSKEGDSQDKTRGTEKGDSQKRCSEMFRVF
jgi:hypothetical protein